MFSFLEVIDLAVQLEKNGEQVYLAALDYIDDIGLKQLLEWMAEEERLHAKWFEDLKGSAGILDDNESLKEMNDALIQDYLGNQVFSLKEVIRIIFPFCSFGSAGMVIFLRGGRLF